METLPQSPRASAPVVRAASSDAPDVIPSVPRRDVGVPSPTDGVLGPAPWPAPPPAFVLRALMGIQRFFQRMVDSVVPANVAVFMRSVGVAQGFMLGAAARFGVADVIERDGPLTAVEIAARTGTNPDAMHRLLRGLASVGVFALASDGRVSNNRLSRAMVGGQLHRGREWLEYCSSQSNGAAWMDLERSIATGESAFDRVFGMTVWDWFEKHPDEQAMFANAMMGMTVADAPVVATLYPFDEVATVCDVGGGRGTLLSEILVRHPTLRGVLCDAPGVLDAAKVLLAQRGVADRVRLEPGSFFESVPRGADAYTLKNILHDWDDGRCVTILRVVRGAMEPGKRVVLAEALLGTNDAGSFAAVADLQMLVACSGGRERSREDFARLFDEAGFRLGRVYEYPTISVIEGIAV